VRKIYRQLKNRGFLPWLDTEDLIGGQDWDSEIQKAVRSSDVIVVCLSNHSITKTGYVQKELRTALDAAEEHPEGQIFIIPLRLCPCAIPDRLQKWQAIDFFAPDGLGRLQRSLLTRTVIGALWHSSSDDPNATERDSRSLRGILAALSHKALLPPKTEELLDELKQTIKRAQSEPPDDAARSLCVMTRTVMLHAYELAQHPSVETPKYLKKIDILFDDCVSALRRTKNKQAREYAKNVRMRATFLKQMRRTFPKT
jgi:hypothetical protein